MSHENISIRESINSVGSNELFVCIGYGDELPVYARARALWQFYGSFFPGVKIIFVKTSSDLEIGEVVSDGYDLLVGIKGSTLNDTGDPGYKETGKWSRSENHRVISRQVAVYDYLLSHSSRPFFIFHTTITSVIDFRGLLELLPALPKHGCFAGSPVRLSGPPELSGFTFLSGANTLISSDLAALLRSRFNHTATEMGWPNDVWQALTLKEFDRMLIPICSFIKPRMSIESLNSVPLLISRLLDLGYFHFRIRTSVEDDAIGRREDSEPWIMEKVMETILGCPWRPQAALQFRQQFIAFIAPQSGDTLAPFCAAPIYTGPHNFPSNDYDAEGFYLGTQELS